jgi:hypothetical protein
MTTQTLRLPLESEVPGIESALSRAFDEAEHVATGLRVLVKDGVGSDALDVYPEVTTEHIAALATIRDDLRTRVADLDRFKAEIDTGLSLVIGLRIEQRYQQQRRNDAS